MKKIDKAKGKMIMKQAFFASLICSTPIVEENSVPTAATDMLKIYYNAEFINSLELDVVLFVLAHEVLHIVYKHGLRSRQRNPQVWNMACDYAINLILRDYGFSVWKSALLDDQYKGMSAEEIYDLLMKNPAKQPQSNAMGDDIKEPENLSEEQRAEIERQIQQRVAQAATMARSQGQLKGELERLVDAVLNPQPAWQDLLREYMTRVSHDDENWMRRNRRYPGVYLPAMYSEGMGEIIVIGDTSGSITNEELGNVITAVEDIATSTRPERVRLIWADTKVAGEQVFENGEPILAQPKGGGGTDMRVPLEYAGQFAPDVVVLITDGYTPWPDSEPEFPLIVCCTTREVSPVGRTLRI